MLGKIQEFSTKLDKKRVYTAIGALIVALAAGHVMQRNSGEPNISVDIAQQSLTPNAQTPPAPLSAGMAPQGVDQPQVAQPVAEDLTPVTAETPVQDDMAAEVVPVIEADPNAGTMAEDVVAQMDVVTEEAALERDLSFTPPATIVPDDAATNDAELVQARVLPEEVTRATTDSSLGAVDGPSPLDIAPLDANAPLSTTDSACEPILAATATANAMVAISLDAPCNAGDPVEFMHAGLRFTEMLDAVGTLSVLMPALTGTAAITATLDGASYDATVQVPDMGDVDRVALVWHGSTGLQLHALENGAFYGDPGHIWAEAPGMPARADMGEGGYVTVLGSSPDGYAADVYSYPVSMTTAPQISIEAQVLEATCGTAIMGEYLRSTTTQTPTIVEVGMVVPSCDAVGEYLVLKNLPQDLTIARN